MAESSGPRSWISGSVEFLKAVRSELGKVTWPTRTELINATRMIVVLSVLLGLVIGWMDLLLNLILVDGVAALSR
ncbi:MAG: preprotein translocase subunit SecE [Gemmatimonadales bacterium]|nr:MAG: preprotein translocase subunit SecE [Gemmatimonadales bacterium]